MAAETRRATRLQSTRPQSTRRPSRTHFGGWSWTSIRRGIDLEIDETDAVITASDAGNEPAMCADDENQYLVILGIDRAGLSHPRYEVATSIGGRTATLEL